MGEVSRESKDSLDPKSSVIKWQDTNEQPTALQNPDSEDNDEDGFLTRQKRRISEHPKISKIQLARKTSKHNITYLRQALTIIASSSIFKIILFILRLIPVSKIIIYGIFYNDCPAEPMIPIYLLVGGVLACVRDFVSMTIKSCLNEECLIENEVILTLIAFLYTLGEFVWFIYGSYFVYRSYSDYPWSPKKRGNYCNNILYMYSFIVTTISYALLGLVFVMSCCTMCIARLTDTPKVRRPSGE